MWLSLCQGARVRHRTIVRNSQIVPSWRLALLHGLSETLVVRTTSRPHPEYQSRPEPEPPNTQTVAGLKYQGPTCDGLQPHENKTKALLKSERPATRRKAREVLRLKKNTRLQEHIVKCDVKYLSTLVGHN